MAQANSGRQVLLFLGLSASHVASLVFSLTLTVTPDRIATVWPANAILAVGLVVLTGWVRIAFVVLSLAVQMAAAALQGVYGLVPVMFCALNFLEGQFGAIIIRKVCGRAARLINAQRLLVMLAGFVPMTALVGLLGFGISRLLFPTLPTSLWKDWFWSDLLGMVIAVPAALIVLRSRGLGFKRSLWETTCLYSLVIALTWITFNPSIASLPLSFLVLPPIMLATFRLGPHGAAFGVLAMTAIALPLTLSGAGTPLLPQGSLADRVLVLQLYIATLLVTSLSAGFVLAQQKRFRLLLKNRDARARAARARAMAANEAKTRFLATMSHEVRTPLNGILGFARLLADRADLPQDVRRQARLINTSGDALLTIVNDVLDFSRVEASRMALRLAPVDVGEVLRAVVAIESFEATAKGLVLDLEIQDPQPRLRLLDETRLRQVLLNLLNNAVKFTEVGGVTIGLKASPGPQTDHLEFTVTDTGPGVSEDLRQHLFERFWQDDASVGRSHGGLGLGLAICNGLVGLMGGVIALEDKPGPGASFRVSIDAAFVVEDVAEAQVAAPEDGVDAASPRILLVDDHPVNREVGAAFLALAGCVVETAESGYEAVELAAHGGFDIILMDIHMPGMDGLAATRRIRALAGQAGQVPIIALSADALPYQIECCRVAGMVDHVSKPIKPEVLYATVERWLAAGDQSSVSVSTEAV